MGPLLPLVLLCALLYGNTISNDFVFDDLLRIKHNPSIRSLRNIPPMFNFFAPDRQYRPLRTATYALDYRLSGLNPKAYHISNILYHAAVSYLVFLMVRIVMRASRPALVAALLFAAHPVQTESVAYLSGRRDLLVALFFFAGMIAFLQYRRLFKAHFLIGVVCALGIGFLAKETILALPLVILCYDALFRPEAPFSRSPGGSLSRLARAASRSLERHKNLYVFLFSGCAAVAFYILYQSPVVSRVGLYGGSLQTHIGTICRIAAYYVRLIAIPYPLCADYSYNTFPVSLGLGNPDTLLAGALVVAIILGWTRLLQRDRILAFFCAWFFLTILPVAQIIPHHELMAEHHLYLPAAGFCAFFAWLLEKGLLRGQPARRYLGYGIILLILVVYGTITVDRNRDWRDGKTLWSKTIMTAPNCARAHYNLGTICLKQGELESATREFEEALRIMPGYEKYNKKVWLLFVKVYDNLGLLYLQAGRTDDAIKTFRRGLKVNYGETKIHEEGRRVFANLHNNLGLAYTRKKLSMKASKEFQKALKLSPDFIQAALNLAEARLSHGHFREATQAYLEALRIAPDNRISSNALEVLLRSDLVSEAADIYFQLGQILHDAGRKDEADRAWRATLERDPGHRKAMQALKLHGRDHDLGGNKPQP